MKIFSGANTFTQVHDKVLNDTDIPEIWNLIFGSIKLKIFRDPGFSLQIGEISSTNLNVPDELKDYCFQGGLNFCRVTDSAGTTILNEFAIEVGKATYQSSIQQSNGIMRQIGQTLSVNAISSSWKNEAVKYKHEIKNGSTVIHSVYSDNPILTVSSSWGLQSMNFYTYKCIVYNTFSGDRSQDRAFSYLTTSISFEFFDDAG